MKNPLVSVIIPTHNRSSYLEDTIKSVINQSYTNLEILVIDDGSKSNYAEKICNRYNNCFYFFKENGGLSSARNYGISKAKGEYIAFLDDDDSWLKNKLEIQVKILNDNPKTTLIHSSATVIDKFGAPTGQIIGASQHKANLRTGYVFWNALGVWVVKSPTPLIRRKIFDDNFKFDESIKVGEDLDFYWRLFYMYKVYYIEKPLAFYRVYDDLNRLSTQKEKYFGIEWKIYTNLIKMGITNPIIKYRIARKLLKSIVNKQLNDSNKLKPKITILDKLFRPKSVLKLLNPKEQK